MTPLSYVARGDRLPLPPVPLPSPLPGVRPEAWSRLVRALCVQGLGDDTPRGLGTFALRPRRLGDLGLLQDLRPISGPDGCTLWTGDFVPPLTREIFLGSPLAQYNTLAASIVRYEKDIVLPAGLTRSGALGVLQVAGPGALRRWDRGPRSGLRGDRPAEEVERLVHQTNGIF